MSICKGMTESHKRQKSSVAAVSSWRRIFLFFPPNSPNFRAVGASLWVSSQYFPHGDHPQGVYLNFSRMQVCFWAIIYPHPTHSAFSVCLFVCFIDKQKGLIRVVVVVVVQCLENGAGNCSETAHFSLLTQNCYFIRKLGWVISCRESFSGTWLCHSVMRKSWKAALLLAGHRGSKSPP